MRWGWKWTFVILAAGAIDFAVRFATGFDMARVVPAETVLFLGTGAVLWALLRHEPASVRWQLRLQRVLVAAFALAGLRAGLWAAGLPVATANIIVGLAGIALVAVAVARRRRGEPAG